MKLALARPQFRPGLGTCDWPLWEGTGRRLKSASKTTTWPRLGTRPREEAGLGSYAESRTLGRQSFMND